MQKLKKTLTLSSILFILKEIVRIQKNINLDFI